MARLETALFGVLEFPVEQGLFKDVTVVLEGREVSFRLYIWEGLATETHRREILAFLEQLPELYRQSKEEIRRGCQTNAVMMYFVEDQVVFFASRPWTFSTQRSMTAGLWLPDWIR